MKGIRIFFVSLDTSIVSRYFAIVLNTVVVNVSSEGSKLHRRWWNDCLEADKNVVILPQRIYTRNCVERSWFYNNSGVCKRMGKSIHRMIFFFLTNYAIVTRVQTLVVYYFQRMQISGKSQFRGKALSKNWNRSYLINLLFFSTPLFCFLRISVYTSDYFARLCIFRFNFSWPTFIDFAIMFYRSCIEFKLKVVKVFLIASSLM